MSDSKIIDFLNARRQARPSSQELKDPFFLHCPNCGETGSFVPICTIGIMQQPIIRSLICESNTCAGDTIWEVRHGKLVEMQPVKRELER